MIYMVSSNTTVGSTLRNFCWIDCEGAKHIWGTLDLKNLNQQLYLAFFSLYSGIENMTNEKRK